MSSHGWKIILQLIFSFWLMKWKKKTPTTNFRFLFGYNTFLFNSVTINSDESFFYKQNNFPAFVFFFLHEISVCISDDGRYFLSKSETQTIINYLFRTKHKLQKSRMHFRTFQTDFVYAKFFNRFFFFLNNFFRWLSPATIGRFKTSIKKKNPFSNGPKFLCIQNIVYYFLCRFMRIYYYTHFSQSRVVIANQSEFEDVTWIHVVNELFQRSQKNDSYCRAVDFSQSEVGGVVHVLHRLDGEIISWVDVDLKNCFFDGSIFGHTNKF